MTAFGEPLSTRCEMPGQALSPDVFSPCAAAGARLAATASPRAAVAMDRVFISDLIQVDASARCGPVDRLERIAIRGGSAGLPRHADRDRRATPFIPACATVNSVCEPLFWFERLIRMAIANSIGYDRPIRFQTGGNGNVFQQVAHLILA
jgi:hypothetical protein